MDSLNVKKEEIDFQQDWYLEIKKISTSTWLTWSVLQSIEKNCKK